MTETRKESWLARSVKLFRESLSGKQQDFTSGNLHRAIFLLAIPMVIEMAGESVFAVVDIYFVASLGSSATAAVGLTESVLTLLYAVAIGLSMGTTAMVARRIGEGDVQAARVVTFQAIALGAGLSLIIAIVGATFAREILELMHAEPQVIETGIGYTRTLFATNVVIMLLFIINAAFRGAGDPALAMRALLLANGINIVLDPCLIHGYGPFPEMGVTGAAVATTIGRGTGVAYQFWALAGSKGHLRLDRDTMRVRLATIRRLVEVSLGGILQMLIGTASWVALMNIVSRSAGEIAVGGYTISVRILIFTFLPAWGLSNAAATLVGQNLGAKDPARAERSVWLTGGYTMAFLAIVTVTFLSLGDTLVAIFTDDPAMTVYAVESLRIISYGYVFYAWALVMMQAFNGSGNTMTPTWMNLFCFWIVQIPMAYILAIELEYGPTGVFWSVMAAESLLAVVGIALFRRGTWKNREL